MVYDVNSGINARGYGRRCHFHTVPLQVFQRWSCIDIRVGRVRVKCSSLGISLVCVTKIKDKVSEVSTGDTLLPLNSLSQYSSA